MDMKSPLGKGRENELDADSAGGNTAELELKALMEIVVVQAQAINDMIVSLNNLQGRVAALEQSKQVGTNGKKTGLIHLQ